MAYSSGCNPHPPISSAGAAPTRTASEAEYLENALAQPLEHGFRGHARQSQGNFIPAQPA